MKLPTRKNDSVNRYGVTIVEVLTSIVVAVIGVAGVLVLIPFAVRQASVGLDLDESTAMAENAIARFEIEGFNRVFAFRGTDVLPWVTPRVPLQPGVLLDSSGAFVVDPLVKTISQEVVASFANPSAPLDPSNPVKPVGYYFIDPLWLNAQFNPNENDQQQAIRFYDMFSYVGSDNNVVNRFRIGDPSFGDFGAPPVQPRFVTLLNSADPYDESNLPVVVPNAMTPAIAARMFVTVNDLQFAFEQDQDGNEIDDKGPPQPYLDRLGNINLRRQSVGRISWSAIAVAKRKTAEVNLMDPDFNLRQGIQVEGFDFYVVVYKDRSFENPSVYAAADGQVNPPIDQDRDPRFLYSVLNPDPYAPNPMPFPNPARIAQTGTIVLADPVNIQNDEWLMLINHDLNGQAQVGFFRVVGSDPRINAITIEGSDFEVQNDLGGILSRTPTYAIYLRNVVNVYKRQLTVEPGPN